jgi:hypothetical protein
MDLKLVGTFNTPWEAGMAKSILDAAEIPAVVDEAAGLYLGGLPPQGVKLFVPEGQLQQALEVLKRWDESKEPLDESADGEDWAAPPEGASCDEPEET